MSRDVFRQMLVDSRRSLLVWTAAIVGVVSVYTAAWTFVNSPEIVDAVEQYPESLREALNLQDFATAAGYLSSTVFGLLAPLLVAVFAIILGTRVVAGDEENGTLDLLLAHPVSRTTVAIGRAAAVAASIVGICLFLWLVLLALLKPADLDGVSVGEAAAVTIQLALFGTCIGAVSFAVGAATGRKAVAQGAGAVVAVVSYLANSVVTQFDGLGWLRHLSPFHWYLGGRPLHEGVQVVDSLLLLFTAAVLLAIGIRAFDRRDIGV